MFESKNGRSLNLSVLMGMLSGVDSDHDAGPRGNDNDIMFNRKNMMTKDVPLSFRFVNWSISS